MQMVVGALNIIVCADPDAMYSAVLYVGYTNPEQSFACLAHFRRSQVIHQLDPMFCLAKIVKRLPTAISAGRQSWLWNLRPKQRIAAIHSLKWSASEDLRSRGVPRIDAAMSRVVIPHLSRDGPGLT